jgi:hypothetical protein
MKASRETIKMKTSEGKVKVAVLGNSPGPEEYLQHISSVVRMLDRKKVTDDMLKLAKAVASLKAPVRRLTTAPPGEKPADKTVRLGKLEAAVNAVVEASAGSRANPSGSASISISVRYILSTPRSSRGCTYYVTSRSLQSPVFEPT